jgi:SAM-dependent methyltransferase
MDTNQIVDTNAFYKEHAEEYIKATENIDMSREHEMFERHLGEGQQFILDVGCGSGRDALYFKSQGHHVIAIDPNVEFVEHARQINIDAYQSDVAHIEFVDMFDGIWACAVLLHYRKKELFAAFTKLYNALKEDGILFCSFLYGNLEEDREGRHYSDLTEESLKDYIGDFKIIDVMITDDRLKENKIWLNVVLKK